jgi:hypothetical protein
MRFSVTLAIVALSVVPLERACAQDQQGAARKFVADAQKWLNAPFQPLLNSDKPVAFVHFTEDVSAQALRQEIRGKALFRDKAIDKVLYEIISDANVRSVSLVGANMAAMEKPPANATLKFCEEAFPYCRAMQTSGWQKKKMAPGS